MDDEELEALCERLAAEVTAEVPAGRDRRWRCPRELRERIVSYARVCRERGDPLGDIAARLGLVESTLSRWLRHDRSALAAGFRSVAIVASGEGDQRSADRPLRLITPRGYCVEGLDPQTLAYVLRLVG